MSKKKSKANSSKTNKGMNLSEQDREVRFDGSQPWTPNIARIEVALEEEGHEAFTFEDRLRSALPVFWTRQCMLVALFVAAAAFEDAGTARNIVMGLIAFLVVPVGFIGYDVLKRDGHIPRLIPWIDTLAMAAIAVYAPMLLPLVLLLSFAQITLGLFTFSTVIAVANAATLMLGLVAATRLGRIHPDISETLALTGFAMFVPGAALLISRSQRFERDTNRKYLDLLGGLDAIAWEADPDTLALTTVSPQVRKVFGVDPKAFIERWESFVHPDDVEHESQSRHAVVSSGESNIAIDFRMVDRDGATVFVRNTMAVDRDNNGRAVRVRGVLVDVTRQQEAENTIRKQAQYDTLTGLPNRSLFNDQLRRRLDDARRMNETLAVHLLDLNGFKEVNDTLGHAIGDQLLQAIAGRLASYLPDRSLVARLGGDEFAVVTFPASQKVALNVAEMIASCLQPPVNVDGMTIQAGASTGIALYPTDGESPAALMRRADAAMYEAKQAGRSHVFAMPDDDESNLRRLQLLGELRASIASGDFCLFHQPKVDLSSGQVVGSEGLIRWYHKQFGLLTPKDFVELSELSGLIQPLTRWVIEQGIRDLAKWRRAGFEITVALNLSVRNFFDQTLPTFIAELLNEHKVPGEMLVLEITESEVMADRSIARTALAAFRSLGVKIAIDDFGTGFSSLSQLQLLPIDEIKVDQSFVKTMLSDPQDLVIVRSIIELGHNLGLEVVAEGAEGIEQFQALRALQADRVQGYVISKPLPPEEFFSWLNSLERVPQPASDKTIRVRVPASVLGVEPRLVPQTKGRAALAAHLAALGERMPHLNVAMPNRTVERRSQPVLPKLDPIALAGGSDPNNVTSKRSPSAQAHSKTSTGEGVDSPTWQSPISSYPPTPIIEPQSPAPSDGRGNPTWAPPTGAPQDLAPVTPAQYAAPTAPIPPSAVPQAGVPSFVTVPAPAPQAPPVAAPVVAGMPPAPVMQPAPVHPADVVVQPLPAPAALTPLPSMAPGIPAVNQPVPAMPFASMPAATMPAATMPAVTMPAVPCPRHPCLPPRCQRQRYRPSEHFPRSRVSLHCRLPKRRCRRSTWPARPRRRPRHRHLRRRRFPPTTRCRRFRR